MLKRRVSLGASVLGVLAIAGASVAYQPATTDPAKPAETTRQPGERPQRSQGQGGQRGEGQRGGNVEGAMKQMNRALKQLQEQIADTTKADENLRLLNDIQRGVAMAKGLGIPEEVAAKFKDAAEKATKTTEYRKDLIAAMRTLLDAEELLAAGKTQEANAKIEVFAEMREKSHKAMGVED